MALVKYTPRCTAACGSKVAFGSMGEQMTFESKSPDHLFCSGRRATVLASTRPEAVPKMCSSVVPIFPNQSPLSHFFANLLPGVGSW